MRYSAKKLTLMAVLTAVALIVFIIEAQIPVPVPIPGAKLGLANVITLFALFWRGSKVRETLARKEDGNEASARREEGRKAFIRRDEGSPASTLQTAKSKASAMLEETNSATALHEETSAATALHEETSAATALHEENSAATALTVIDALMILICRIILGAAFSGSAVALIYSITGGMFAFTAEVALRRFVTDKQIWVCGVAGAVFHNVGQILAAMLITGTPYIAALLPVLTVVAIITGVVTGLVAQFTVARLRGVSTPRSTG